MSSETKPISFRLDAHYLEHLKREAAQYGMSAGDYARRMVIDTLEDVERKKTQDQMRDLKREIVDLRADVATTALALLVGAGKIGKDEAQMWVRENLKTR